jgi:regulatory protein
MPENELFRTALTKAMAQCAKREYCISDIRTKLDSWNLTDYESEKIITVLLKENFINEERFATGFVKAKFNYNKWGKIKLSVHLKAKKIPGDIIKKAFDSIDNDHYIKTLNDLISSHRRFVKSKNQYEMKAKLLRYGLSKGFESSLIYDVLNDMEE